MKEIEKTIDEEIEVTLIAPKTLTAVDAEDDTFGVVVDTNDSITVYLNGEQGYTLEPEEIERLISKLSWALGAKAALTDRVPF